MASYLSKRQKYNNNNLFNFCSGNLILAAGNMLLCPRGHIVYSPLCMSSSVLILEQKNKVDSWIPYKAMAHSTKCIIFSQIIKETNVPIPGMQWDTSGFDCDTVTWQQCH